MASLRSRRLEEVFGTTVNALEHEHIKSLVTNAVREQSDLDFKLTLYERNDKGKYALAGDVAAMANTAGGVILLGVGEDDHGAAGTVPGVDIGDEEIRRIHSVVAGNVFPLPALEVRPIKDPDQPEGHGLLAIIVPRSSLAPHGVLVNSGFRYPRRNGTTTTYLSESDVATAYRERFAGLQSRAEDAEHLAHQLIDRLDVTRDLSVVVSLVPDLPGMFTLDSAALSAFRQETISRDPRIVPRGSHWRNVGVAGRRLTADGGKTDTGLATWMACDLHTNGSGAFALALTHKLQDMEILQVADEDFVMAIWSGLDFLVRHARDRAATTGNASVYVTITSISNNRRPAQLVHYRGGYIDSVVDGHTILTTPTASGIVDIDGVAESGPEIIAATARLANDIVQHFGLPENYQVTTGGSLRRRYWDRGRHTALARWAEQANVDITDDVVG
ncbi:helix-turn-helix domain-containing protein [Kitasatospora sp. NPDC057223]|uniref:AlbA family DNA-binding domain-containing protein n=1 Tax=Kitasatospora sp. NPDC057223 TaxID=3346055 RepID=UPI0036297B5E